MSHFLLFLPGERGQDPALLRDRGLDDLVAGAEFADHAATSFAPRGGVLVAWRRPGDVRCHVAEAAQDWLPQIAAGEPRYWVGTWRDSPPAPEDLRRADGLLDSHRVELGDGCEWEVPAAARLPRTLRLGPEGLRFELFDRYRSYWDSSCRFREQVEAFYRGEAAKLVIDADWWDYLVGALRLNYRILPEIVSHLGLLTTSTCFSALAATVLSPDVWRALRDTPGNSSAPAA